MRGVLLCPTPNYNIISGNDQHKLMLACYMRVTFQRTVNVAFALVTEPKGLETTTE